jgi:uncharacterized coiled-coil protein SlyX
MKVSRFLLSQTKEADLASKEDYATEVK